MDAMKVILGLIPLDLHIMKLVARARKRTDPFFKGKWDGINGSQKKKPGKVDGYQRLWGKFKDGIEVRKATSKETLMN